MSNWRAKKKLVFSADEEPNSDSGSNSETDADSLDSAVSEENTDDKELDAINEGVSDLTVSEKQDGEWMSDHPWESAKPDPNLKMKDTVANSASYPTSPEWKKGNKGVDVDLGKIFMNLPKFVASEMKGTINSGYQELEEYVRKDCSGQKPSQNLSELSPHAKEIVDKFQGNDSRNDRKSLSDGSHFKATSISHSEDLLLHDTSDKNYVYFDCEHMLKIYVPDEMFSKFDIQKREKMQWIRKISYPNKEKRWIFIPSYRRAKIALLQWPEKEESTIRTLVVRPSEFDEYVKFCGHLLPVICLPQDELGAGYPRYWIQKIALRLKLQFIWMIDDSVECFYEYNPDRQPPGGSYKDYRRRKFGLVFQRIEDFVKEADDSENPIAAMSPRRFDVRFPLANPFVCKPPQGAVYLNLRALLTKNIYYRPELKTLEDMIFGYECEKKGLKVFMDNRVHLQDHNWKDTGASSPSVKGTKVQQKTAAENIKKK